MDKDAETWKRKWQHGKKYGNMDDNMETWMMT